VTADRRSLCLARTHKATSLLRFKRARRGLGVQNRPGRLDTIPSYLWPRLGVTTDDRSLGLGQLLSIVKGGLRSAAYEHATAC